MGNGLADYTREPKLNGDQVEWVQGERETLNDKILRPVSDAFQPTGGLAQLQGNIGRAVMKTSAVSPERHIIKAPARVFHDQHAVKAAFKAGEFTGDTVIVVRFQGPCALGMPELHALTPTLAVLQDRGLKVALVTDGRMSGASGKIPSAIHVCPEAAVGGGIAKIRDGDMVRVDAVAGTLDVLEPDFAGREAVEVDLSDSHEGMGRELFQVFRQNVGLATKGAAVVV